jgi:hypothetical protein
MAGRHLLGRWSNLDTQCARLEFDKHGRAMRTMKGINRLLDRAKLIAKSPSFAFVGPSVASPVSGT